MADVKLLPERIRRRIDFDGSCWMWLGYIDYDGYGKTTENRRHQLAHRVVYARLVGPIPQGLTIDHLCRRRACVNPEHLEPVTQKVNTLRGNAVTAENARKTHCGNGHPFDVLNTHWTRSGTRDCRACKRANEARRRARQKAGKPQP